MEKFIAVSPASKKIIQIAKVASTLDVDVIILGEVGVGKKVLANQILTKAPIFEARELEQLILSSVINLEEYKTMIIYNINKVLNKNEFLAKLKNIKIVATGFDEQEPYIDTFAIKIKIPPLEDRKEDLEVLTNQYIKEAKKIYTPTQKLNAITLKQSIYKNILLQSMNKQEIMSMLNNFFLEELKNGNSYKTLLEIFEIPLLKASKSLYKSQVQISKRLKINRITLRKKLNKYFGN
jgi:DNA-binding NtrC family response regulator